MHGARAVLRSARFMSGRVERRDGFSDAEVAASHATARTAPTGDDEPQGVQVPSSAGLVLLYAPGFRTLPPAIPFDRPMLEIGRDPSCAIVVDDHAVSRTHARIAVEGRGWTITDLTSRNGTYVDGERVSHASLESFHEIRVGNATFKFVDREAERYVPYRIDGAVQGRLPEQAPPLVGGWSVRRLDSEMARIGRTNLSCIVLGETGTGKEVVAQELHRLSGRVGAFHAIHCGAIPQNLLESELFGYRRGAFSGAHKDKPGLIQQANAGTLFLDEIGDMPLEAQVKLLRVLQSHEVMPLGDTRVQRVDLRVICATHRDLYRYVQDGRFRGDLYARLNEYSIELPPLRERKEDLFSLVRAFASRHSERRLEPSLAFMNALIHYDWPFNVRELESVVKRAAALADGGVLEASHLPQQVLEASAGHGEATRPSTAPPCPPLPAPASMTGPKDAPDANALRALLEQHAGNVSAMARDLGTARMQVYRWLRRYGLDVGDYRQAGDKLDT
jgi:DNA-binding NtrC family response regulator